MNSGRPTTTLNSAKLGIVRETVREIVRGGGIVRGNSFLVIGCPRAQVSLYKKAYTVYSTSIVDVVD